MKISFRFRPLFWRKLILILFLLVVLSPEIFPVTAATSMARYTSRTWQTEDGLPQNNVYAITQTPDGYLWVGTQEGLARFDGIRFTVFDYPSLPETNSASSFWQNSSNSVGRVPVSLIVSDSAKIPPGEQEAHSYKNFPFMALCKSSDGNFWIGTGGAGLACWRQGQLLRPTDADGFLGNVVRTICESRDDSIWVGTEEGLHRFQDGKFKHFTLTDGLANNMVRCVYEDREGRLWIATDGGLNRFQDGVLTKVPIPNGAAFNSIRAFCQDREGNLWIGTHGGLVRMKDGIFSFFTKPGGSSGNIVNAIYEDRNGHLWIGTFDGLNRFSEGNFFSELNHEGVSYGLINSIMEDREANLWIGSKNGLSRLNRWPFMSYTTKQGLTHDSVTSVLEDKAGNIWIGTWGGGLNCLHRSAGSTETQITAYNSTNGLGSDFVLGLGEDHDGNLWIGTPFATRWLKRFRNGQFTAYGEAEGFLDKSVKAICADRQGNLWIGAQDAVNCFKDGKFTRYTTADGLLANTATAICEDQRGNMWFGTAKGWACWDGVKFISDPWPYNAVMSFCPAANERLWMGVIGIGLKSFQQDRSQFYSIRQGVFSDIIHAILDDDLGYLWMSCNKGVFRIRQQELDDLAQGKIPTVTSTLFGKADGMSSSECTGVAQPSGWKSKDGRLWFATAKGLAVVDPRIKINDTPPLVVIEEIMADKKMMSPDASDRENSPLPTFSSTPLLIPPGRGELEFHYTGLSFRAPEKNRFKYKLEGVDSEWVDAGARRIAYYNNIKPGAYWFRAIGCNNDGVWNELGANVKFTLQPHYWQTWWFRFSFAIAGLSLVGAGVRSVTKRRMQFKLDRLEQKHAIEKERTRIAQDMHDDLGVRLSEILLLSNLAHKEDKPEQNRNLNGKISGVARELVDNLDAIVWAVNPKNDSLDTFAHYLYEVAPQYLETSAIRCLFDAPLDLPDYPLSSEVRHNLYLVVKESLHNVVKHAHASEVRIRLAIENDSLFLSISDNGRGFAPNVDSEFGNGLLNMKERMKKIGGQFNVASETGKGTRINLEIPIKEGRPK